MSTLPSSVGYTNNMIYGFFGENTFMRSRALKVLEADFGDRVEHVDGTALTLGDLPDLLMATTLFDDRRMIIIKNLSENDTVWSKLDEWLSRVADEIDVVFVDTKPDRRTQIYKQVKALGMVSEFPLWDSKNEPEAVQWLMREAEAIDQSMDAPLARHIIQRVGFDQYQLVLALEKLSLSGKTITIPVVDELIDVNITTQAFSLFESFFEKDTTKASRIINELKLHEDPYRILGLLSSQVFQLSPNC